MWVEEAEERDFCVGLLGVHEREWLPGEVRGEPTGLLKEAGARWRWRDEDGRVEEEEEEEEEDEGATAVVVTGLCCIWMSSRGEARK